MSNAMDALTELRDLIEKAMQAQEDEFHNLITGPFKESLQTVLASMNEIKSIYHDVSGDILPQTKDTSSRGRDPRSKPLV